MSTLPTPADGAQPPAHKVSSSTPVKKSLQGSQHFASQSKVDAELLKVDMAEELAGQWVGPMPVKEFIDAFLPLDDKTLAKMPKFRADYLNSLAQQDHEDLMYDPFIQAVENSRALPNFKLVNTSSHPDTDAISGMKNKPDVSCYQQEVDLGHKLTNFEEIELILEFKPPKYPADPFDDDGEAKEGITFPFESKSDKEDVHNAHEKCRGQLACYTRVWSSRQHRTHCFILWLGDPNARIIRMDRSGGIVSAKFNYRTEGNLLLEFFWRFSQSKPDVRGRDTTVSKASSDETKFAKSLLKKAKFIPASERSVFKIQVPDAEDKKKTHPFLVWGPLADPRSATGRATRGYPAVDPRGNNGNGSIVFLKDTWRSCEEGMEKESAILHDLNKKGCRNVPTLICGDDVDGQFTITKNYVKALWNIGGGADKMVHRVHNRFVQEQVGYHLERFKSSREFLLAVFDAFLAHRDAYEKCGILHRDISAGNILMRKNGCGGGFLNDWDLAKRIDKGVNARQPFRSGTWQFMSAALLEHPDKVNTLQDDLESFLWLVLFHVLRYMKHNRTEKLKDIMASIFDEEHTHKAGEPICGGWGKQALFSPARGQLGVTFAIDGNEPLTLWISFIIDACDAWYRLVAENDRVILRTEKLLRISHEEAAKQHPLDDRNSPLRNHHNMISTFEAIFKMDTWPESDQALDAFSPQVKRSRELGGEAEHKDEVISNVEGDATTGAPSKKASKRVKTSTKLDDSDAAYKPSPLRSIAPPVFSSRETRPNDKPEGVYAEKEGSGSE